MVLAIGMVLSVIGVVAIWGHFWEWRIGDPSAQTCGNCHVIEPYVESLNAPDLLASSHAARGVTCTDCHSYDVDHQVHDTVAYVLGCYAEPLDHETYGMDLCFQCHEHGSYDQIAWRTMDLGVTDPQAKGNSANPHGSPHYTNLECNLCHQMHAPSTLYCWQCHTYDFGNPQFKRPEGLPANPSLTELPATPSLAEPQMTATQTRSN